MSERDEHERETDLSDQATAREDEMRDDAIAEARRALPCGPDHELCRLCDEPIGIERREALPGVETCIDCQEELELATGGHR